MKHFAFLESGRDLTFVLQGHYNFFLVTLSFLVAVMAAYTAFLLSERIRNSDTSGHKIPWLLAGALALGGGVWAMHFIGMLALTLPVTVRYDVLLTVISVLPSLFASLVVLHCDCKPNQSKLKLITRSVLMGAGIGIMHYAGMAAMRMDAEMRYDPGLFALSIVVAVVLALLSLRIKQWAEWSEKRANLKQKEILIASIAMGGAITGMHYTGMAAVYYFPAARHLSVDSSAWEPNSMALLIALVMSGVLMLLITAVYVSRRLALLSQLQTSEIRLQTVFDTVIDGILTIDRHSIIESINPAAEKIFGYSRAELLGKNINMLVPELHRDRHDEYIRHFIKTNQSRVIGKGREVQGMRKDGSVFPMHLAVNVAKVEDKLLFTGVVQDISDRKSHERALVESERRANLLQNTASITNAVNDPDQAIEAALQNIGDYMGWALGHVFYPEDEQHDCYVSANLWYERDAYEKGRDATKIQQIESFKTVTKNSRFKLGEGMPGRVAASAKPLWIEDVQTDDNFLRAQSMEVPFHSAFWFPVLVKGKVAAIIEFFSEQEEHYKAEFFDLLLQIGRELGHVIQRQQTEAELNEARITAEGASKSKSQFLASMSHEIRTPMNGVLGMLHLLSKTELTAKQKRFVETAAGSGEMLLTIINDILDFSKMEAGKLDLESIPFEVVTLVEETAILLADAAHAKGLELVCRLDPDMPHLVKGDPTRLRQVLTNLASNAIKFTEQGEVVLYAAQGREGIRFGVIDTGIGLTPEQQQAVFKAFTQADSSHTRKYGGTGLGLAISTRLVAAMGGKLSVASESGEGSEFTFDLPLQQLEGSLPYKQLSELLPRQRILVVDDNQTNRDVLSNILENWGIQHVALAESGPDALQQLRTAADEGQRFDITLLDMHMPEMHGVELARAIRADERLRDITLIMLSSMDREEDASEIDMWLTKPVRQSDLYNSLLYVLGEQAQPHALSTSKTSDNNINKDAWWFGGRKLLLAEDNETNQQVAWEILSEAGFSIDIRDNGAKALLAVQENQYDAVLMDIQMPVLDGIEATKRIRALGGVYTKLPIIAMTAHALSGDSDKSLQAGMNGHITKPINPDEIFRTLSQWIEKSDRPEQAQKQSQKQPRQQSNDINMDELPEIPGVDLRGGLERIRCNWSAYQRILKGFRQKQSGAADAIQAHIAKGEMEQASSVAHTLKGSSGNIGAEALYKHAAELEAICRDNNKEAAQVKLDTLRVHLQQVTEGLLQLEKGKGDEKQTEQTARKFDNNAFVGMLEQLEAFLDTDLGEAQNCLQTLIDQVAGSEFADPVAVLEIAINSFDMDAARQTIQSLKQQLPLASGY